MNPPAEDRRVVLLVDDDEDEREMARFVLEAEGHEVVCAAHGKEALEKLVSEGAKEPALIVLDLRMPVMSGWEFLSIVKSYRRLGAIPVLVVSAITPSEDTLEHGALAGYLPKPLDERGFRTAIRGILSSRGSAPTIS